MLFMAHEAISEIRDLAAAERGFGGVPSALRSLELRVTDKLPFFKLPFPKLKPYLLV